MLVSISSEAAVTVGRRSKWSMREWQRADVFKSTAIDAIDAAIDAVWRRRHGHKEYIFQSENTERVPVRVTLYGRDRVPVSGRHV